MAYPIQTKRAYDDPKAQDGQRFLVDGMWPRGVKKEDLEIEAWLKDVAPSKELRQWFGHDPEKWEEFRERYWAELNEKPESWRPLAAAAKRGKVTLIFAAKDEAHNNAVALKGYLEDRVA